MLRDSGLKDLAMSPDRRLEDHGRDPAFPHHGRPSPAFGNPEEAESCRLELLVCRANRSALGWQESFATSLPTVASRTPKGVPP